VKILYCERNDKNSDEVRLRVRFVHSASIFSSHGGAVKKVQIAKRKYDRIANEGNRFAISYFYANANINVGQEQAPALQYLTIFCYTNN